MGRNQLYFITFPGKKETGPGDSPGPAFRGAYGVSGGAASPFRAAVSGPLYTSSQRISPSSLN